MARSWKASPVVVRASTPTPSAIQQLLPFAEVVASPKRPETLTIAARVTERLWFCIWLPHLPLESCRTSDSALAIVEEQHGIHRVLHSDAAATARGIMAGQSANAALALLPTLTLVERSQVREQQVIEALATWLEQFSSFVSIAGKNILLLEIAGSLRLFGGLQSLRQTLAEGLRKQGFTAELAIAPTPLAATWLARAGARVCIRSKDNVRTALHRLPLSCLGWALSVQASLSGMGVSTIGDCLRLPREGFARRFGAEQLLALDRALGFLADPRDSWRAAERFCVDYEMTEEQSDRELLLNICQDLLLSHEHYLLARQLATQRLRFSFFHLRGEATELTLGSAFADRSAVRWLDLLRLRFENLRLSEPVIAVRLRSGVPQPLQTSNEALAFDHNPRKRQRQYSVAELAERLMARIGEHAVNAMTLVADHRPELAWRCQNPLQDWSQDVAVSEGVSCKRPLWMLPTPVVLQCDKQSPYYKGQRLTLLEGPERIETGWWDADSISRDYYSAISSSGVRLWVFRNRQPELQWYLHGIFG